MVMHMTTSPSRFALFSYGFRPFFLGGAIWAAFAMLLWIALLTGHLSFALRYGAVAWHAHEFLFGYGTAIVAGFLLTAVPNWTGRLPIRGMPLFVLFTVWLAGRIALLLTDVIGLIAAEAIDSLFLLSFAVIVFREIIAGKDRRNLKVALILVFFALANIAFHTEVNLDGDPSYAIRATTSILVILIMLIGGRIIPSFTRNWLAKQNSQHLPTPFNTFDRCALGVAVLTLVLWAVFPDRLITGLALILSALIQTVRLARWSGVRTNREVLVLILHIGYAFIPFGFLIVGVSAIWPPIVPPTVALHAWTAGAVGVMTLAVMTRASRGHSGRPLTSPPTTTLIYLLMILSVILRLATVLIPDWTIILLELAAATWIAAFFAFAFFYGPMLIWARDKG